MTVTTSAQRQDTQPDSIMVPDQPVFVATAVLSDTLVTETADVRKHRPEQRGAVVEAAKPRPKQKVDQATQTDMIVMVDQSTQTTPDLSGGSGGGVRWNVSTKSKERSKMGRISVINRQVSNPQSIMYSSSVKVVKSKASTQVLNVRKVSPKPVFQTPRIATYAFKKSSHAGVSTSSEVGEREFASAKTPQLASQTAATTSAQIVKSDAHVTRPDSHVTRPDSHVTRPDSHATGPGSHVTRPDARIDKPEPNPISTTPETVRTESPVSDSATLASLLSGPQTTAKPAPKLTQSEPATKQLLVEPATKPTPSELPTTPIDHPQKLTPSEPPTTSINHPQTQPPPCSPPKGADELGRNIDDCPQHQQDMSITLVAGPTSPVPEGPEAETASADEKTNRIPREGRYPSDVNAVDVLPSPEVRWPQRFTRSVSRGKLWSRSLWRKWLTYVVEDINSGWHMVEGSLVKAGNQSVMPSTIGLQVQEKFKQTRAQYGRANCNLVEKVIENTDIQENQMFVDIGSGIGQVVLQVSATVGCKSFGVELMQGRHQTALNFFAWFQSFCDKFGPRAGDAKVVHGDFRDERLLREMVLADVWFVNNANDTFGVRSVHKGHTLNWHVAQLSCRLRTGAQVVCFDEAPELTRWVTVGVFEYEQIQCDAESVSWTDKPIALHKYTKVKDHWTCAHCTYNNPLVTKTKNKPAERCEVCTRVPHITRGRSCKRKRASGIGT